MVWPLKYPPSIPDTGSPAGFGFKRSFYYHPGIDLYCPEGTRVVAAETGTVVGIEAFTGPDAEPASPWWNPTEAVLIEGSSGVVGYCELITDSTLTIGDTVQEGQVLGRITPVLKRDKGNGTTMLHLELYRVGTRSHVTWHHDEDRPEELQDPIDFLKQLINE